MADIPRLNLVRSDRPSHTNRHQTEERRRRAAQLRVMGLNNLAIALRLAADPRINTDPAYKDTGYPGGYGARNYFEHRDPPSHDSLRHAVGVDLGVVRRKTRQLAQEAVEDLFELDLERSEAMIAFAWPKAMSGSEKHIGRVTEILERRAKMLGFDKTPISIDVTGSIGLAIQGPAPEYTPEFVKEMARIMRESNLEPPEIIDAIEVAATGELPASTGDHVEFTETVGTPDTVDAPHD